MSGELITNLIGTGTVSSVLQLANVNPGLAGAINLGLSLSSGILLTLFGREEKVLLDAKVESIRVFMEELDRKMKVHNVSELVRVTNIAEDVESYTIFEELIGQGIQAKTQQFRELLAMLTVYFTKDDDPAKKQSTVKTIEVLKSIDERDLKLLNFYVSFRMIMYYESISFEGGMEAITEIKKNEYLRYKDLLIRDNDYYAEDIYISSRKLELLGLVDQRCSLKPFDELFEEEGLGNNSNKGEMLDNFISLNQQSTLSFEKFVRTVVFFD